MAPTVARRYARSVMNLMSPIPQLTESGCLSTIRRCFWIAGIQISQLSASRGNQGDPDILEHFVPPRAGPPFYLLEDRTETFYVVQGRFRFRCGANDLVVAAGQFLQLPRGLPHLYENVGADWGRLLNVISPGGLELFYIELEAASRSCPVSFERILQLGSQHGISILTSQINCRTHPVT